MNNTLIQNNLRTASATMGTEKKVLVIRQVVVPRLNDESNIRALAELARGLPHLDYIELLPYHNYGMNKYQILGRHYQLGDLRRFLRPGSRNIRKSLRATVLSVNRRALKDDER